VGSLRSQYGRKTMVVLSRSMLSLLATLSVSRCTRSLPIHLLGGGVGPSALLSMLCLVAQSLGRSVPSLPHSFTPRPTHIQFVPRIRVTHLAWSAFKASTLPGSAESIAALTPSLS